MAAGGAGVMTRDWAGNNPATYLLTRSFCLLCLGCRERRKSIPSSLRLQKCESDRLSKLGTLRYNYCCSRIQYCPLAGFALIIVGRFQVDHRVSTLSSTKGARCLFLAIMHTVADFSFAFKDARHDGFVAVSRAALPWNALMRRSLCMNRAAPPMN